MPEHIEWTPELAERVEILLVRIVRTVEGVTAFEASSLKNEDIKISFKFQTSQRPSILCYLAYNPWHRGLVAGPALIGWTISRADFPRPMVDFLSSSFSASLYCARPRPGLDTVWRYWEGVAESDLLELAKKLTYPT